MHILLVCCSFVNSENEPMTGMPKAVLLNASGLKSRGHDVKILTTGNKDRQWTCKGIDIISFGRPVSVTASTNKILIGTIKREHGFTCKIRKLKSEWGIDVIQYAGLWGTGLFRNRDVPAIMRVSGYTKLQRGVGKGESAVKVLTFMDQVATRKMDAVFCPSNMFAKELSQDTGRKMGVLETPFIEEKVIESDRVYRKFLDRKKYILYIGRISWDKGFPVLSNTAFDLLEKHSDLHIVVAGESVKGNSSFKNEMVHKAGKYAGRVHFLGMLSHARLYPIIKNSEAVVLPSMVDNLPNSCMEAMSLGAIVIGTNGASFEQLIIDGENGFLSEIGDAESLKLKIDDCIDLDDENRAKMSLRAQETIKKLDLESYLDSLENIYKKVMEHA